MQTLADATTRELFNRPGNPGRRHQGATWPIVLNGNLENSMPHKHHKAVRQGQQTAMCRVKVADVADDMAVVMTHATTCNFDTLRGGRMAAIKPTRDGIKCIGLFTGHPHREDVDYRTEKDESMEMISSHDPSVRAMGVLHLLNLAGLVVSESHPHVFEMVNNLTKSM